MRIPLLLACSMALQVLPAAEIKEKVIYSPQETLAEWKITPVAVDVKPTPEGLEFSFSTYKEGDQEWPRLLVAGPKADFTDYSRLVFEIEALDEAESDFVAGARSGVDYGVGNYGVAAVLGGRRTENVMVDISDGSLLEQSHIHEVSIGMFRPRADARFRLRSIKAIKNPDFVTRREALAGSLGEAQAMVDTYAKHLPEGGKANKGFAEAQQIFESAKKDYEKQNVGYAPLITAKLDRVRFLLGKMGMQARQEPLAIWLSPLSQAIRADTLPDPSQQAPQEIQQRVVQGQYLAVPINFSASDQEQKLEVSLEHKQGDRIALRQALWAKARDGSMTADAINLPAQSVELTVKPFSTEQVILWIDAKSGSVSAGKLEAKLRIAQEGKEPQILPISVTITDMKLAEEIPLATSNWAYFYTIHAVQSKGLEVEARDNLRNYGMNTWIIHYTQAPLPKFDENDRYLGITEESLASFRQVMELLQGKPDENFVLWLGLEQGTVLQDLEKPGVLEPYVKAVSTLLDEYKVPKDRRYFKFMDEPDTAETLKAIEFMKKIRAIDPSFRFFDNSSHPPSDQENLNEYLSFCDLWVPNWEAFVLGKPELSEELLSPRPGKETGYYRCLMGRNNKGVNIYEYYRLMGWHAMDRDLSAIVYWCFDFFENPWDGTEGSGSGGATIYSKDGQLLTSRRGEMVREAIDDYRLAMLALGTDKLVDIKSSPELRKLCDEVLSAPSNLDGTVKAREQLIDLAEKRLNLKNE